MDDFFQKKEDKLIKECIHELKRKETFIQNGKKIIKRFFFRSYEPDRDLIKWPVGILLLGLHEVRELEVICSYYDKWIDRGAEIISVEDILAGQVMLDMALTSDISESRRSKYMEQCRRMAEFVRDHECDEEGSITYNENRHNGHIYADSIGMICPFVMRYGQYTGQKEYVDMAFRQISNFMDNAADENTGLPYHGYRYKNHEKYGMIGWGRAVGWIMMGMAGCLKADHGSEAGVRTEHYYLKLTEAVTGHLNAEGLAGWDMTDPDSQTDTSASAMIFYALSVYTPEPMKQQVSSITDKGLDSLMKYVTAGGKVMQCQAECGGFGIYPDKFGSYPWSVGMTLACVSCLTDKNDNDG
jgi:rhamnogalacturonyl hydrolase YesR